MSESCENCRFWFRAENEPPSQEGWCQRNAPVPVVVVGMRDDGYASSHPIWPLTNENEWCGEWKPLASAKENG